MKPTFEGPVKVDDREVWFERVNDERSEILRIDCRFRTCLIILYLNYQARINF